MPRAYSACDNPSPPRRGTQHCACRHRADRVANPHRDTELDATVRLGRVAVPDADGISHRIVLARSEPGTAIDVRRAECERLQRLGATSSAARRIAEALVPASMTAALAGGPAFYETLRAADRDSSGTAVVSLDELPLVAPIDPPAFRDFVAFEQHFVSGDKAAGRPPISDVLYEFPIYYMGNPSTMIGPDETVPWPSYSSHMDYELEVGIVIGRQCHDLTPEAALDCVAGITILNDFTARDIQFREMEGGLGPAKGKHFASAVGPWLVTLDEVDLKNLPMQARINEEIWSNGNLGSIMWSPAELVAWASAGETLPVGALLGTGTVGTGSGFEQGRRSLIGDDVVELDVAGIGVLRNRIGPSTAPTWTPQRKQRTIT